MAPIVIVFYLPFFRRLNVTTAYEYLERRFNVVVRLFGSASFILFQLGRMAIVVFLPALALSAITGINVYTCILIMGILSTVYTVLGGMEAVIWTDVLQTFVLWCGMLIGLIVVIVSEDGVGNIYNTAAADGKFHMFDWSFSFTELVTWSMFLGTFLLQFGPYTTDQSVIQRYLTTKDEKAAAKSIWTNGILAIPFGFMFFALGTCLYVYFKHHPELLSIGMQNDQVFPLFVAEQLPAGVSGLVIAGVFAASMSSMDSSMHSISTAVTTDFYRRFKPDAPDEKCLKLARRVIIFVGVLAMIIACALATYDIKSLFFFFQKLLGLLSSGLVGIFILGIFTKRANVAGALAGAIVCTGLLVYVVWFTNIHFYLYAAVGISTCVVVGYLVSVMTAGSTKDLSQLTLYTQRAAPTEQEHA
jgi:SSS family transporter